MAEYYHQASCLFNVPKIKIPTLVLHAKDDPIIPVDVVPIDTCVSNPNIIVGLTRNGGHCQYFKDDGKGLVKDCDRWYGHAVEEFIESTS